MAALAIPILPSADFDVTSDFFQAFGFAEQGRWPSEYLILRHAGIDIELHFWFNGSVDRWTNDVACYVRFDTPADAVTCHAGWADVVVPEPAELTEPSMDEDGSAEFHIIDLHGNLIRLGGFAASA